MDTRMVKSLLLGICLASLAACKSENQKVEDPWAEMSFKWCSQITNERLQQAGYQDGEPPKNWTDSYKDTKDGIILGCSTIIYNSVSPCRVEYKFGSDSALQCVNRYTAGDVEAITYILSQKIPIKQ